MAPWQAPWERDRPDPFSTGAAWGGPALGAGGGRTARSRQGRPRSSPPHSCPFSRGSFEAGPRSQGLFVIRSWSLCTFSEQRSLILFLLVSSQILTGLKEAKKPNNTPKNPNAFMSS